MQIVHHLVCVEPTVQTFTINSKHTHIIKTLTEAGSCGPVLTCSCSLFLQTPPFHQGYNSRVNPAANPATNYPPTTEPTDTGKSLLFRNTQAVSLCNFDSKTKTRRLLNSFTVWIQTGSFCFSVGVMLLESIWLDCCLGIWIYYVLDMWWIHAFVSGKQLQMWFYTWKWWL